MVMIQLIFTTSLFINIQLYHKYILMIICRSLADEHIIGICEGMKKYGCDKLKEIK